MPTNAPASLADLAAPSRTWPLRPITGWGEHSIPADAEMRQARLYRTCRNWQFGWWLRQRRNFPDAPPTPHRLRQSRTTGPGQLAFE